MHIKIDDDGLKVPVPKQWKHWCRLAGLRVHGGRRGQRSSQWFYLKGRGYVWRLNCYAQFQRGDTHAEFDRWALCNIDETTMPLTQKQFMSAVEGLVIRGIQHADGSASA